MCIRDRNKGEKYARLDITHHSRLSRKEIRIIEDLANEIIESDIEITREVLNRAEADKKFGFDIYQGGPPKHDEINVISIGDFDVQACGGTHHDRTSKIGELRIIRSSQVQDGWSVCKSWQGRRPERIPGNKSVF